VDGGKKNIMGTSFYSSPAVLKGEKGEKKKKKERRPAPSFSSIIRGEGRGGVYLLPYRHNEKGKKKGKKKKSDGTITVSSFNPLDKEKGGKKDQGTSIICALNCRKEGKEKRGLQGFRIFNSPSNSSKERKEGRKD